MSIVSCQNRVRPLNIFIKIIGAKNNLKTVRNHKLFYDVTYYQSIINENQIPAGNSLSFKFAFEFCKKIYLISIF